MKARTARKITAIPPTIPPTMGPTELWDRFELPEPEVVVVVVVGVVVDDAVAEVVDRSGS